MRAGPISSIRSLPCITLIRFDLRGRRASRSLVEAESQGDAHLRRRVGPKGVAFRRMTCVTGVASGILCDTLRRACRAVSHRQPYDNVVSLEKMVYGDAQPQPSALPGPRIELIMTVSSIEKLAVADSCNARRPKRYGLS